MGGKVANIKLNDPGNEEIREALLGEDGYGMPVRLKGYILRGEAAGRLAELFEINSHPKARTRERTIDPEDKFAWEAMSEDFWKRLREKVDECHDNHPDTAHWELRSVWQPKRTLQVFVFRDDQDPALYFHYPVVRRDRPLNLLFRTMAVRMRVTNTKAEQRARENLLVHLNGRQRRELLLNGSFVEKSRRSGVYYLIRMNRPTIAYRLEDLEDRQKMVRVLAVLCLHPLGYYDYTFAGCCPPSDEMLAHLLSIRTDERKYWAKSEQHDVLDPLAGI